jgi:hypothetical protein
MENLTEFGGKPIRDWKAESGIEDPERFHYRIRIEWDDDRTWLDLFAALLEDPKAAQLTGLIVGSWDEEPGTPPTDVIEAVVAARERLPGLRTLFLGDLCREENEISWIVQDDVAPLFSAYPDLEHFGVRGGNGLHFGSLQHATLRTLVVETGGLPVEPLQEVLAAQLPALQHLELWLGTDEYGWNGTMEDLSSLFAGELFPNLSYLGLRDSQIADEIAVAIAEAPILQRIRILDLSLGTLSDVGAAALLRSPSVRQLEKLDLHHHYMSPQMVAYFTGVRSENIEMELPLPDLDQPTPLGTIIEVDVSEAEREEEFHGERYRYVAVGE